MGYGCEIGFYCSPNGCSRYFDCPYLNYSQKLQRREDPYGFKVKQEYERDCERWG